MKKNDKLFDILLQVSELEISIEDAEGKIFQLVDDYKKTLDMNNSWDRHKVRGVREFLLFCKE